MASERVAAVLLANQMLGLKAFIINIDFTMETL